MSDHNAEIIGRLKAQIRMNADCADSNRQIAQEFCNRGDTWAVKRYMDESIMYERRIRRIESEIRNLEGRIW